MAELAERHEVRVRGKDNVVIFSADSEDGKLVIRQEREGPGGKGPKQSCAITLSDPEELRAFFKGLRRIMASLGTVEPEPPRAAARQLPPREASAQLPLRTAPPSAAPAAPGSRPSEEEREALVAKARTRNPQAFAPWTKDEEQEIARRYQAGDSLEAIARTQKRSVRAIELRLQRMGLMPKDAQD